MSVDKRLKGCSKKTFRRELEIARMDKVKKHGKRIRLTRAEIERAKQQLLAQAEEKTTTKQKPTATEPKYPKDFWRDGVYCDSYGWAWGLDENLSTICVGRTRDILKRESSFTRDNENHSCHSKLKNNRPGISSGDRRFVVANLKNNPRFLKILRQFLAEGLGIRAIQSRLKVKGYEIPLRTLARWIKKQREVKSDAK